MNTTSIVNNPIITFTTVNENILTVSNDGTIQPIGVGSTFVDIYFKKSIKEDSPIIAQKRIEISVEDVVVVENVVSIRGNNTIFFDGKAKYIATLFKNGLELDDTFEFTLLNDIGLPLSNKTAKLANVLSNTCEIQVSDFNANIQLIAKSISTNVVEIKNITIRDIL